MNSPATLDEFLLTLPALAESARPRLDHFSGLFLVETKQGRRVYIRITGGTLRISGEESETPTCSVTADETVLLDLIGGKLSPAKALLTRKAAVRGDVGALWTLIRLLA